MFYRVWQKITCQLLNEHLGDCPKSVHKYVFASVSFGVAQDLPCEAISSASMRLLHPAKKRGIRNDISAFFDQPAFFLDPQSKNL